MTELSLHILDVAENSTAAGAKLVKISVLADLGADKLTIVIEDDGRGMSKEMAQRVTDPFTTSRTTRRVGLGLPLLKMAATSAGGSFSLTSELGVGTTVSASFMISHIDRQPLGDLALTIVSLLGSAGECDLMLKLQCDEKSYIFDTRQVKEALGETDLTDNTILWYLQSMIRENLEIIFGGTAI